MAIMHADAGLQRFLRAGLLMLLAVLPLPALAQPLDAIAAVINDDVITHSELEREIAQSLSQLRESGGQIPARATLEPQILERLILQRLQFQEADRLGIKIDEAALTQAITNIATRNGLTLEELRATLEAGGMRFENFREDTRKQMRTARLQAQEVMKTLVVTDPEIDRFLKREADSLIERTEVHLFHLLIAVPETASTEEVERARKKAEALAAKLRAGADFATLARRESDGRRAAEGGDLGWFAMADVPSLVADLSRTLAKGEISPPLRSPSGFHLIKMADIRGTGPEVVTQTHARHILLRTNEVVSDEDARTRLGQLRLRILGGDDFATLARSHSDDTGSALKGGDLGWLSPGDTVPEFENALGALAPNDITPPFKTSFGWHIAQVLERRRQDTAEELLRIKAREVLRGRKADEAVKQWLRRLRDEAYVEVRLKRDEE